MREDVCGRVAGEGDEGLCMGVQRRRVLVITGMFMIEQFPGGRPVDLLARGP